jgi:hypothetical protein
MAERQTVAWTINGVIPHNCLGQIFGASGSGKTFVHLDMALHVATGRDWNGHKVRSGAVLLVAGEGFYGLSKRLHAWAGHYEQDMANVPLVLTRGAIVVPDRKVLGHLRDEVLAIQDRLAAPLSWIVLDTLNRNFGGGDENSTQDMNAFIQHIDTYLRQPYRCAVMIVHHSGTADKDRGRGSSALKGAIDAEYKVQLDQSTKMIQLEAKKMKEAEMPPALNFNLTQVDLPIFDKHGEAVKGAFLQTVDISGLVKQANEKHVFLGNNQQKAMKALAALEYTNEQLVLKGDFPRPIDHDAMREACKAKGIEQKHWKSTVDALVKKGLVSESGDGIYALNKNA